MSIIPIHTLVIIETNLGDREYQLHHSDECRYKPPEGEAYIVGTWIMELDENPMSADVCPYQFELDNIGWDSLDPDVETLPPGRHMIQWWAYEVGGYGLEGGIEWESGIKVVK